MSTPYSPRVRVSRGARRACYEPEHIRSILDAGWICHLSVNTPKGAICIPTIYGRIEDEIFIHGSSKSGLLSQLANQVACVVVSLVDGIVVARSAFHHSVNYRSVVIYAQARLVEDTKEKLHALDVIINHALPGRAQECRPADERELRATSVWALPLADSSAKIRNGPPNDDAKDLELDHWAGVIPIETRSLPAVSAPDLRPEIAVPSGIAEYLLPEER